MIMKQLTIADRRMQLWDDSPSLAAIDSQSVKIVPGISIATGIDGGKKINGRKRHIAVDSEGRPLAIYVGPANQHDGEAGLELLPELEEFDRLNLIRADIAYRGIFKKSTIYYGWETDTTQSPLLKEKGLVPQPNRWQVERSFGWLNAYRRLSKDYEKLPSSSESFISLSFCNMMLIRLMEYAI